MRVAPSFQFTLHTFDGWAGAVAGLTGLSAAALTSWLAGWALMMFGSDSRLGSVVGLGLVSVTAGGVGAALTMKRLRSGLRAISLRWDRQCWHWGPAASRGQEPCSGQASLCIDLGFFLLLRLSPFTGMGRARWLPVQRQAAGASWHLLRCTLYASSPQGALAPGECPP